MKAIFKTLLPYALVLSGITFLINYLSLKHYLYDLETEVYIALVGILFLGLGIWLGNKIIHKPRVTATERDFYFEPDQQQIESFGLSKREMDVWLHLSQGLSNQEIAEELYISLSTVKTHTSNLYSKLGVRNRSTAIILAKENGLLA